MASLLYPRCQPRGCSCLSCTNKTNGAYCSVGALLALASGKAERRQVHFLLGWCTWDKCTPWEASVSIRAIRGRFIRSIEISSKNLCSIPITCNANIVPWPSTETSILEKRAWYFALAVRLENHKNVVFLCASATFIHPKCHFYPVLAARVLEFSSASTGV